MVDLTAVLLSWKRPFHIPQIVDHLRSIPSVRQIIVLANEVRPTSEIESLWLTKKANVIHSHENLCTYGRFYAAAHAACDHIFVQDDDLIVNNMQTLIDEYDGSRIIANLADDASSKHWQFWQQDPKPYVELGFGSIFPKRFASKYLGMQWTDERDLLFRKSDKAFTCLFPWTAIRAGHEDITRLFHGGVESGKDENALYKRTNHKQLTEEAVRLSLAYLAQLG